MRIPIKGRILDIKINRYVRRYGRNTDAVDIKVYANEELQAGWKAQGISTDEVKKELKRTMRVLAGLENSTAVTTDASTSPLNIGAIKDMVEEMMSQHLNSCHTD